jgi:hypothetical protein
MLKGIMKHALIPCAILLLATVAAAAEKPAFDLSWYGYVKLDGAYDQNLTSHGNFAMWVQPKAYSTDDEQFNMTANQTRMGFNATGKNYEKVNVGAKIEFDLYGGVTGATVPENKAMLMLRHAYFTVQSGSWKLLAGQSWDLISPLNPNTLNYSVLWSCGNIQYRRPQVSLFYTVSPNSRTTVELAGGFFRTIGDNLTPTFTLATGEAGEGADDGTDAGIPSGQGRLDITYKSASGTSLRFGASGLYGQLKSETTLGHYENYDTWGASGHFQLALAQGHGISGEVYTGSNMGSYLGAIGNRSTIAGVSSSGAWGSAWIRPVSPITLGGGYGLDDPKDEDLVYGSTSASTIRSKNQCVFGNVLWTIVPQVTIGAEVSQWRTTYLDGAEYDNLRLQTSFQLTF